MISHRSVVSSYLCRLSEAPEINDTKAVRKIEDADVFLEVPLVRQSTDYSCGAASFLSILGYYGYDPYEKQIMKTMGTTLGGTHPSGFEKAAKKFQLKSKLKENMSFDDVRESIKEKIPVIMAIQAWGDKENYSKEWKDGHYVVAVGFDKDGFFLMDPSQMGYSYISEKQLEERWHDVDQNKTAVVRLGIMIYGKEPRFDYDRVRPID